jgi:hypothetical protein
MGRIVRSEVRGRKSEVRRREGGKEGRRGIEKNRKESKVGQRQLPPHL